MPTVIELQREPAAPTPARRPRAHRALIVGVLIAGLLVGGFALITRGITRSHQDTLVADGISSIVITHDVGAVSLVAGPVPGRVEVSTQRRWSVGRLRPVGQVDRGVLTLTGGCPRPAIGPCRVEQTVSVPAGVAVQVRLDSGNLRAVGLDVSGLDVSVSAGRIHLDHVTAALVRLRTGSGAVSAALTGVPRELDARSGSGDITLTVPRHVYRVDADSDAGKVRVGVEESADAPATIAAHTKSGDVRVRY